MGNTSDFFSRSFTNNFLNGFPHHELELKINHLADFVGEKGLNEEDVFSIPPRVIVYDILPYFSLQIDKNFLGNHSGEPFCLFGYFKKDITRRVFFLFRSLYIALQDDNINILSKTMELDQRIDLNAPSSVKNQFLLYLDFHQVENLVFLVDDGSPTAKSILKVTKGTKLRNLKRLVVGNENTDFDTMYESLFCVQKPKNMKFVHLDPLRGQIDQKTFFKMKKEFNCVTNLALDSIRVFPKGLKEIKALKTLFLSAKKEVVVSGPFLSDESCDTLKKMCIMRIDVNDSLFVDNCFSNLQTLLLSHAKALTGDNWKLGTFKKMRKFHVAECPKMTDEVFKRGEFPFLEDLLIISGSNDDAINECIKKGIPWVKMPLLAKITLIVNFSDKFFVVNDFNNVTILKISGHFSGEGWQPMEKLKKLYLWNCPFKSSFFKDYDAHPQLEYLTYYREKSDNDGIDEHVNDQKFFDGWSQTTTSKLKFLVIRTFFKIPNVFFQNNFSNLKKMEITPNRTLSGVDWKVDSLQVFSLDFSSDFGFTQEQLDTLPTEQLGEILEKVNATLDFSISESEMWSRLQVLKIMNCDGFEKINEFNQHLHLRELILENSDSIEDEYFQELYLCCLPLLEALRVSFCSKLKGKGWMNMKKLSEIYFYGNSELTDQMFIDNDYENLKDLQIWKCNKFDRKRMGLWKRSHNCMMEEKSHVDRNMCVLM